MKEVEIAVTGGWLCTFGAGERAGLEIGAGCGVINVEGQTPLQPGRELGFARV